MGVIGWSTETGARRPTGSEFAVFEVENRKFTEIWFDEQDIQTDASFRKEDGPG